MIFVDFAMALCVVAVCTAILVAIVGWDGYAAGGWPTAVVVFGLFLLIVWVGGIWLTPIGPNLLGPAAAWTPFIIVGFMVALLWAAAAAGLRPHTMHAAAEQAQAKMVVRTTFIVLACVIALVTVSALVLHYVAVEMPPNFDIPQATAPREA